MKKKQVYPKPNNTSIVIYYSMNGNEMRYPTGITISKEKKKGKYVDWNYKLNMLKPYVNDFDVKKKTISDLCIKANSLLSQNFEAGISLTPAELKQLLEHHQEVTHATSNSLLLTLYSDFLQSKKEKFLATNTIISLKDFTSTKYLLEAFEAHEGRHFRVSKLTDMNWLSSLLNFMRSKHPEKIGDYKLRTQGKLNDKTIKKRFDVIAQFADYLKDRNILTFDAVHSLKKFRNQQIKVKEAQKETLTIDEVHKLFNFKFKDPKLNNIRDIFVFLCFTGIRFQDLVEFDKRFIKVHKSGEGFVYIKKASKNKIEYNIPLCGIVLEILEKYDYKLPVRSNVESNLLIKEALKQVGIFEGLTESKHKITGEYKERYEAITMHKARDTFITNLIDTTPLNELMKYTGHKKLTTLQGYIDKRRDVKMNYVQIFDKP